MEEVGSKRGRQNMNKWIRRAHCHGKPLATIPSNSSKRSIENVVFKKKK